MDIIYLITKLKLEMNCLFKNYPTDPLLNLNVESMIFAHTLISFSAGLQNPQSQQYKVNPMGASLGYF